tara:strand:+ start:79 stop:267 length:189 start_codon:yes stop_codon:yes gene_type:complete
MTKENAKKLYEHYCEASKDSNLTTQSQKVMKEAAEDMLKKHPEFKEAPKKEESKDAKKPKGQ